MQCSNMFGPSSSGSDLTSSSSEDEEPPVPAPSRPMEVPREEQEPETPVIVADSVTPDVGGKDLPDSSRGREKEAKEEKKEEAKTTEVKIHTEAQVPPRVRRSLEKAKTLADFKELRVFTFLHLFAGPKDILGDSIRKKAKEAGLEVHVEGLDRKMDPGMDLSTETSYRKIGESIDAGERDGYHAGFPCGSFSRARHNKRGEGPPPVRSGSYIYGFEDNSREQQREADRGTLMASQSTWLYEKQTASQKRRKVPEVSLLENPPGSTESGSAWDLPEVKSVVKSTGASIAEFNTCQYQSQLKERWYKPSRWCGRLDLESLSKVCKCPAWIKRTALVGKGRTEPAGAYPVELTDKVASMIISSWKRTLNLEWWRHQYKERKGEVDSQKEAWLRNEEKRRKRVYEDSAPVKLTPVTRAINATEEYEDNPSTTARPSKMQRREEENKFYLGGMWGTQVWRSRNSTWWDRWAWTSGSFGKGTMRETKMPFTSPEDTETQMWNWTKSLQRNGRQNSTSYWR